MSNNPKRWLEQVLPKKTVQQAATLMNEQCWCWGKDIRYGEGNLLLTYGFRRDRAPSPNMGSNMYSLHLSPTQVVVLWGWGLFYGEASRGAVFIGRNGFAPLLTLAPTIPTPIFSSGDLPSLRIPTTETEYQLTGYLTGTALRWVAGYEAWISPIAGESHRLACLAEWRKRPVEQVVSAHLWGQIADEIERALVVPRKLPLSA